MDTISEDAAMEEMPLASEKRAGDASNALASISGIIFSKSVRSSFCSFHVALVSQGIDDEQNVTSLPASDDYDVILVRLQFPSNANLSFRSHCRRFFKLGDLITFHNGTWSTSPATQTIYTDGRLRKLVLEPVDLQHMQTMIRLDQPRQWNMTQCQQLQLQYCQYKDYWTPGAAATAANNHETSKPPIWMDHPSSAAMDNVAAVAANAHGSGLQKRVQAEYIARFLVHMIMYKLHCNNNKDSQHSTEKATRMANAEEFSDPSSWATSDPRATNPTLFQQAVEWLNTGTGVIDAAGGSGHVSMQLGLLGIRSTVIDAREAVGKLPGRDRKIWNQALQQSMTAVHNQQLYCQPVVEYAARRGWFGPYLDGVDTSFRHPNEESLEIYDLQHELFVNCSAVVALHPDEATEGIVSMAVDAQKAMVVVPCCVFARLFPQRLKPGTVVPVSTRLDLLEYLAAKHKSIRQTTLSFQGANSVLWTSF